MKAKFKKAITIFSLALAVGFTPTITQASGVPTVDLASLTQLQQQLMQEIMNHKEVIDQWEQNIKTAESQLQSMTGFRSIANFSSEFSSVSNVTKNLINSFKNPENLLNEGLGALGSEAKKIMAQYGVDKRCSEGHSNLTEQKICEAQVIANVTLIERKQQVSAELQKIISKLEQLSNQALYAQDLKESQDIANQIAIAQSSIQVLSLNYDMIKTDEQTFSTAIEQRKDKINRDKLLENNLQLSVPKNSNSDQW